MILEESAIIITGAAGNIGEALVISLSKKAKQVFALDFNENGLTKFKALRNVNCSKVDVTDEDNVDKFFSSMDGEFSSFGLLNAAGIIFNRPLVNLLDRENPIHPLEDFKRVIDLNLTGTFIMGSHFSNFCIKKRKKACVVNFSSVTASGNIGQSAYSASKAAVESLSRVWAKELGMFKIRAVSIAPGFFDTESTSESLSEAVIKKYKTNIPLKKFGNLQDLEEAIEFILSNEYYTGEVLALNGGYRV